MPKNINSSPGRLMAGSSAATIGRQEARDDVGYSFQRNPCSSRANPRQRRSAEVPSAQFPVLGRTGGSYGLRPAAYRLRPAVPRLLPSALCVPGFRDLWLSWQGLGALVQNSDVSIVEVDSVPLLPTTFVQQLKRQNAARARNSLFLGAQGVARFRCPAHAQNFGTIRATRPKGRGRPRADAALGFMIYDL